MISVRGACPTCWGRRKVRHGPNSEHAKTITNTIPLPCCRGMAYFRGRAFQQVRHGRKRVTAESPCLTFAGGRFAGSKTWRARRRWPRGHVLLSGRPGCGRMSRSGPPSGSEEVNQRGQLEIYSSSRSLVGKNPGTSGPGADLTYITSSTPA